MTLPADVQIRSVGAEQIPVIIWDDFSDQLTQLKLYACEQACFQPDHQSLYPGLRAPLPETYVKAFRRKIEPVLRSVYELPEQSNWATVYQYLSMINRPESELAVLQRLPHFDSTAEHSFALLLYVNPGKFGGTGFFRHRPSGYETVDRQRFGPFVTAAERHMIRSGPPPARYTTGSSDHFELLDTIAYRPNRLLAYPGQLLHSGLIDPRFDLGADPTQNRLTANLFVRFEQTEAS